jgi:acetyl-CoA carboxylase biotin carboxyl carrier protein
MTEPDETTGAALVEICRSVAEVLRLAPRPPQRISVTLGAARVEVEWSQVTAGAPAVAVEPSTTAVPDEMEALLAGSAVCAPLVGTFYRAPNPGAAAFVQVGDVVRPGQQLGIVEAMKLMNPVEATEAGRVVRTLVGDGEPVEFEQPLFILEPLDD